MKMNKSNCLTCKRLLVKRSRRRERFCSNECFVVYHKHSDYSKKKLRKRKKKRRSGASRIRRIFGTPAQGASSVLVLPFNGKPIIWPKVKFNRKIRLPIYINNRFDKKAYIQKKRLRKNEKHKISKM